MYFFICWKFPKFLNVLIFLAKKETARGLILWGIVIKPNT